MRKILKQTFRGIAIALFLIIGNNATFAQNAGDLRFSEILVYNDSNYVDGFGNRGSWIEIFNSAYNPVDIGGCYLTNDINNPTKYWIPFGDPSTIIPARCFIVFWADNKPSRGIFHLNFELEGSETIALYNANGRSIIDKLDIPYPQTPDITYGRVSDDSEEFNFLDHSTPGSTNDYSKKATSGEKFVELDPSGVGMAMIAMTVVFSALIILFLIYKTMGNIFVKRASVRVKSKDSDKKETITEVKTEISGEINAAIAMALYLYQNELHDHENTVLTIQKVSRTYSPWSSKIYTLRKQPR
jgi:Na+-transporting methylmalonyl-CoA/oxaloacetate decarboxylase gamma subunit